MYSNGVRVNPGAARWQHFLAPVAATCARTHVRVRAQKIMYLETNKKYGLVIRPVDSPGRFRNRAFLRPMNNEHVST